MSRMFVDGYASSQIVRRVRASFAERSVPMLGPGAETRRRRIARWRIVQGLLGVTLAAIAILVPPACASMGASAEGERLARMKASPQWSGETFVNKLPTPLGLEPNVTVWMMAKAWIFPEAVVSPTEPIPVHWRTASELAVAPAEAPRITWFGHSSMLIELDGKRILTDPVWGERVSPVSWAGPKRFHAPPIKLEDLPPLDAVIISHDHYDHLDMPTIELLAERVPLFVVPLGVGAHLESWGVAKERIVELDWWQEHNLGDLRLVSTPCRHFSGRGLDRNVTLWTSWALVGPRHRVFFSGDTGMHADFDVIGEKLGPFDVAMLEVGAYNSWWRNVHLGPEQALEAHRRLRGRLFIPIHWGTFDLALHAWTEPPERLLAAADRLGVTLSIPQPGDTIDSLSPPAPRKWWPTVPWQSYGQAPVVASNLPELPPMPAPEKPLGLATP